MTLTVITFKWTPNPGYRSVFHSRHVNTLARMVRRHYPEPHRFVCITDDPRGITEPGVEVFKLWNDFSTLRNPSGAKNPSCYRRLRLFARNTGSWLGERIVCLDLDCVIVGDMRPIWDRPEDFVIWRATTRGNHYNGSMFLLRAGTRERVWMDFDPYRSPIETKAAGFYGSDQAWISYRLGNGEAVWSSADGVHSFRNELVNQQAVPPGTRIVFMHGKGDPWSPEVYNRHAWVREHYR